MENIQPVRILHVVTYMGRGGLETMVMNYYRHIDRRRVQFDFLVHRDFRADYDDEIQSLGGKIYRLPRLVPWSRSYHKAVNTFFTEHPEYKIIHVHQDCLSSIILKAAQKHGVSVRIAHSHNSNQDINLKLPVKLFYRRQIPRYATDLFACGKEAGDWMFCGSAYKVINNAIDARRYVFAPDIRSEVRKAFGIGTDALVVGHVGRFMAPKNHEFLLRSFARLPEHAVLLVVGDGELRKTAEQQAEDLGVRDRVIFTGVRGDVNRLLQAMDVFVFPSLYEGLPVSIIEAQAAGLPCLISDKVPIECKKTDLVTQIPLDAGEDTWAEAVLNVAKTRRESTLNQIRKAGFDIEENAAWLQAFYLSCEA